VFDVNNIRYITSTKIGEWERDKLCRWALLTRDGEPILWDWLRRGAPQALYALAQPENCKAGLTDACAARQSRLRLMARTPRRSPADQGGRLRQDAGRRRHHRAADAVRARRRPASRSPTASRSCWRRASSRTSTRSRCSTAPPLWSTALYHLIHEELKPGVRENDIVAKVNESPLSPRLGRR
jgi:Xaa-Pro dipeptidase